MNYLKLSDCAYYSKLRTTNITVDNYITTDNMIPNKGGIRIADSIPNQRTASKYEVNDILISNIRPYFKKIWLANREGSCSNDVLVIKNKESYLPQFLYYVLSDNNFFNYDTVTSKGTKMPRGTPDAIMKYLVPDVNIEMQEKISTILSKYDSLIINNNKRISILERMAEEIYKNLFAYHKIKNYSEEKRLEEILDFQRGISYSSEEIDCEEGNNLINLKNINAYGGFRRDGTKKYNGKYKDSQIVKSGDLIMGVTDMTQDRRTVGSVALVPTIESASVISADLVKVNSKIDNTFLYAMFKYGNLSMYISQFANGANVLHLKPQVISNVKVQLPNIELINSYVKVAKPIIDEIDKLNLQNDNLVIQRDLLLPRLMSGKLEIN